LQRQRERERERLEQIYAEKARQQEKRIRLEHEQLAVLRMAKQPLGLRVVPSIEFQAAPVAPVTSQAR
jgi:hypothetical protein